MLLERRWTSMFKLFEGKVRLEVKAASPFDEVFLIDGGYNRVAKGVGGLVADDLEPGLYKLKFKAGNNVVEMSKVFNQELVKVEGPPIELASSPLPPEDLAPSPTPALRRNTTSRGAADARASRSPKPRKRKWRGAGSELFF